MPAQKIKIMILTGDAGLGHRSAAEAIKKAFEIEHGDRCNAIIYNPLNHSKIPDFIRESQSDYDEVVKNLPELYRLGYEISDSKFPVALMEGGFTLLLLDVMREILKECQPDLVVTTYPIYPAPLTALHDTNEFHIPLISVVTDLITVHHVWFHSSVTKLAVPTEIVQQQALKAGLTSGQVIKTGIPVNPEIRKLKRTSKCELRAELGWDPDQTAILVVGSPRITSLMDILKALDSSDQEIQFALVAGGNESLHETFENHDWNHPVNIYGFVDFMPQLMRAADVIVCKAGGLIVTESLASGLPLMLVHVLPGQEEGNADFVVDHNAGALCKEPEEALGILSRWLVDDKKGLKETAHRAEDLGQDDAAFKVVEAAWDLL